MQEIAWQFHSSRHGPRSGKGTTDPHGERNQVRVASAVEQSQVSSDTNRLGLMVTVNR
jgi:hypothetical protein